MSKLLGAMQKNRDSVRDEWLHHLKSAIRRQDLMSDCELEAQVNELLVGMTEVPAGTTLEDFNAPAWDTVKNTLTALSVSRATQGFTPSETAFFVLSAKPSLFNLVRKNFGSDANALFSEITTANDFIDKLALHTTDSYISGRDQIIARQQEEMLELS